MLPLVRMSPCSLLGVIDDDFVASPYYKFFQPERDKVQAALDRLPIRNGKLDIF